MRSLLLLLAAAAAAAQKNSSSNAAAGPNPLAQLFFPAAVGQLRAADDQMTPWLAGLARSLPAAYRTADKQPQARDAVSAIEEFTGPLVRFATGGQPVAADVEQLIDSIPHLAQSASAMREGEKLNLTSIDVAQLPSSIVAHVVNGGEIPGIDRAELDRVVHVYMKRMSDAAERALRGETTESIETFLPPINKVPVEMLMSSLQGNTLPGLTTAETAKIREYYTKQLPSSPPRDAGAHEELPQALTAIGTLVAMLPSGYDVGRIPPEFIKSIMKGRVPDISLLPRDLQDHLNKGKAQAMLIVKTLNSSVNEALQHLHKRKSTAESPRVHQYDIAKITHEVIDVEKREEAKSAKIVYVIAWIAFSLVVSTIVLVCLFYKYCTKRKAPLDAQTPVARGDDVLPPDSSPAAAAAADHPLLLAGRLQPLQHRLLLDINTPERPFMAGFAAKVNRYSTPRREHLESSPTVAGKRLPKEQEDTDSLDIYDKTE